MLARIHRCHGIVRRTAALVLQPCAGAWQSASHTFLAVPLRFFFGPWLRLWTGS